MKSIILAMVFFLIGCTGKQGPVGPAGNDGASVAPINNEALLPVYIGTVAVSGTCAKTRNYIATENGLFIKYLDFGMISPWISDTVFIHRFSQCKLFREDTAGNIYADTAFYVVDSMRINHTVRCQ